MSVMFFISISDKNLIVSINGDLDEAKALSKPQEDSQGTNNNYIRTGIHIYNAHLCCRDILQLDSAVSGFNSFSDLSMPEKHKSTSCFPTDDESDSDTEEEQEKTVSCAHTLVLRF